MFEHIASTIIQQVNVTGSLTNGTTPPPELPVITLANAFGDVTSTLIIITLMLAMTVRTSSEFIEALVKGETTNFNRKYLATAAIAFVTSLPIAMGLFPEGAKIFLAYFGDWGLAGSLFMVAVYGYGWNHAINKGSSLLGHFFTSNPKPETKTPDILHTKDHTDDTLVNSPTTTETTLAEDNVNKEPV